ncbi:MAG: DUF308 domain-containing protein [Lachnospiraceae bacterium]|nr:DUF308 domain-containing protein [Lachnospiraceae bacterium]
MRHAYFRIIMGIVLIIASIIAMLTGQEMAMMTTVFGVVFLISGISQFKKASQDGAKRSK